MTFPEHYNPWKNTQIQTSEELLEFGVEEPSKMMMDSTIRKIKHIRRRNTTAIITYSYRQCMYVLIIDCDDKTLVILLEELRPLRLVLSNC